MFSAVTTGESVMMDRGNQYAGHNRATEQAWARRTAAVQAAFFLPYLRAGMNVVDCGCGQGTITAGLAEAVAPGEVVGFDTLDEHLDKARAFAVERGLTNLRFEHGDINAPPFERGSFDAAFIHVVLCYLDDPLGALLRVKALLRPGGVVGVVDVGHLASLVGPGSHHWKRCVTFFQTLVQRSCNNPYTRSDPAMGLQLKRLFREAGLSRVKTSAFVIDIDPAAVARLAAGFRDTPQWHRIVELGIATSAELEEAVAGTIEWSNHLDAWGFRAWPYAVGFKD